MKHRCIICLIWVTTFQLWADSAYPYPIAGYVFADSNGNGSWDSSEKGVAGVGVSDGEEVVVSDKDGYYCLPNAKKTANRVFVTIPSGYSLQSHFYYLLRSDNSEKHLHFPLRLDTSPPGERIEFLQVTDVHVWSDSSFYPLVQKIKVMEESEPQAAFVMSTGDLGHDDRLDTLVKYKEATEKGALTWRHVVGNHDLSYNKNDPTDNYLQVLGPDYYSFDYGPWHFVVLNDFQPQREKMSTWLDRDLTLLGAGKGILFFVHCPPQKQLLDLRQKFPNLKAIFSGHFHGVKNIEIAGVASYNTSSFRFAGCDYTPPGYRVIYLEKDRVETSCRFFQNPHPPQEMALPCEKNISREEALQFSEWREFKNSPGRSGMLHSPLKPPLRQLWEVKLEGRLLLSSPVAAKGKVFVGTRNFDGIRGHWLYCLDICDGSVVWRKELASPILLSPTISGDRIYVETQLGTVHCWSLKGEPIWQCELGDGINYWFYGAPIVEGNLVYAGCANNLCALDKDTGKIFWGQSYGDIWTFSNAILSMGDKSLASGAIWSHVNIIFVDKSSGRAIRRFYYGSPRFAAGDFKKRLSVVLKLRELEHPLTQYLRKKFAAATLALVDTYDFRSPISQDFAAALATEFNAILADEQLAHGVMGLNYSETARSLLDQNLEGEQLLRLNRLVLHEAWPVEMPNTTPTGIANAVLYRHPHIAVLNCDGLITILDESTWETVWSYQLDHGYWTIVTPSLWENHLYAADSAGILHCIDLEKRRIEWSFNVPPALLDFLPYHDTGEPLLTSPLVDENRVFFGASDGNFYVLDRHSGRLEQRIGFGSPITSTPAVYGPVILVGTWDGEIYALRGE